METVRGKLSQFLESPANIVGYSSQNSFLDVVVKLMREENVDANGITELNFALFCFFPDWIKYCIANLVELSFQAFESGTEQSNHIFKEMTFAKRLRWHILYRDLFLQQILKVIHKKILNICKSDSESESGNNESPNLFKRLQSWLSSSLVLFLQFIFEESNSIEDDQYYSQILQRSVEIFVSLRSQKLFEMITDYPESLPDILELKECAGYHSSYLIIIGKALKKILNRRLLHLGASTMQILDFYISMIKSLRLIDSSDVLLNYVAVPIRDYLKLRKDTIRCILSSLTESKDSDLHEELKHGSSLAYGVVDEDDESAGPGENWQPSNRYKELKNAKESSSRGLDILATLVSIYGSTELFIAEYRSLLSEKLLSASQYLTDSEVANLELLKIRFGDESLHNCEVMLRDVEDSKRTNTMVHNSLPNKMCETDFLIVSEHYWPHITPITFVQHPFLRKILDIYHETYMKLKKPRKLQPFDHLGYCDFELSFADGSQRTFTVTPLQASVISYIGRVGTDGASDTNQTIKPLSFQDLMTEMEINESDLVSAIRYWLSKGVIRECTGQVTMSEQSYLIEEEQATFAASDMQQSQHSKSLFIPSQQLLTSMEPENYAQLQHQDQQRQKLAAKIVGEYVKSLLKSHGSLTIDRLFTSLQLLLQAGMTENTNLTTKDFAFVNQIVSLKQFIQSMSEVDCFDGFYSMRLS